MEESSNVQITRPINHDFDRARELKAFDETKAGVKGLVDAGTTRVPRIFYSPPDDTRDLIGDDTGKSRSVKIPVIDLEVIRDNDGSAGRNNVVGAIREACGTWGFFQAVNHGIPVNVLDEMLEGSRKFYEQDVEAKREWYTRDGSKTVVYNSNFDLYGAAAANWRDTTYVNMAPTAPKPDELPEACRDILIEYCKQVHKLGILLFELLSEALSLDTNHLNDMGCSEGLAALCHYYPSCPEPDLTLGATKHSDYDFLTLLLQDNIGGLQVLYDNNRWVDIPPVPGALVVNVGDLLQLISNDKFKSSQHRVLANRNGPRVSVACFFTTGLMPSSKRYGPIKELCSEESPPKYRETSVGEDSLHYNAKGLGGVASALLDFRI